MNKRNVSLITRAGLVLFAAVALSGCFGPRLEVLSQQLKETVIETSGEDDYAYRYRVLVRNKGAAGRVRAIAELYTAEGQFYRERIVSLGSGQEAALEFVFTEPSVAGALLAGVAGETQVRYRFRYESVP